MARFQYGGQALMEGVLMRGRHALAVALRHPDGTIVWASERLDEGLRAHRIFRLPFVRGLVVLYDTLVTGTRWLVRSATIQAAAILAEEASDGSQAGDSEAAGPVAGSTTTSASAPIAGSAPAVSSGDRSTGGPQDGLGKGFRMAVGVMLLLSLVAGIGIFFLVPLLVAQATVGRVDRGFGLQLSEGIIRVAIFIGYLMLTARAADLRRVYQYHGAEHMSIHALEAGDPLTTEAVRRYPTAHPRCGTEFLVVVLLVSIIAFALIGNLPPLLLIASRVALVPVIAAVSYELLQLGARHRSHAIVRWLWSPGIWVQKITTRQPTDDMIEVAIVSLQRALVADGAEIPEGSAVLLSRPLAPDRAGDEAGLEAAPDVRVGAEPDVAFSAQPARINPEGASTRSSAGTPKVNPEGAATRSSGGTPKVNPEGIDS